MTDNPAGTLETVEAAFPALVRYVRSIAVFFEVPYEPFRRDVAVGFYALGEQAALEACRAWQSIGIFPDIRIETDEQIAAVWDSPIFQIVLEYGLKFCPPEDVDVTALIPPPCRDVDEFTSRAVPPLTESYWRFALHQNLPELYLDPFLPANSDEELLGCDLASGWGRIALGLRDYTGRRLFCCDLSQKNVNSLTALVKRAGLSDRITPRQCDITRLPFEPATFDFFLAFDIFEHLSDAYLKKSLEEILRCAKPGAVIYTEIPLFNYFPAVTHIQDFSYEGVVELFETATTHDRTFRLKLWQRPVPFHFTFEIV